LIFHFLKYVQPTNYFALFNKEGKSVFPIIKELPQDVQAQINEDQLFQSELAIRYDLSWQAIQIGYIGEAKTITSIESIPLVDEYYFIRKYFNPLWTYYILLIRILGFKNPIKEISAWKKSKKGKRSDYLKTPILYKNWEDYSSKLIAAQPKVSVVIPTLNRYPYLKDVLEDLEKQEYSNFEVIVVDQSEPFQKDFYDSFNLDLQVIDQREKALWLARNTAVKISKGNLLLLFDDDSRVEKDWITNHIKCIDFFNAEVSSGVSISTVGAKVPENYSFFRVSDQIDTGNVLIKKEVFKAIGMFDRQFEKQRMGDGEFGLRVHLEGFLNISNPFAQRLHLKVGTGGLRQMGSWDGFRPKKWLGPRPIPSVVYYFRKYYGAKRTKYSLLKTVPPSIMPYRFKKSKKLMIFGALLSLFISPLILFQVIKSWRLASKKLKQGDLIEPLDL
jgi:glycosyltransferase involved in cell wall biosynthesis